MKSNYCVLCSHVKKNYGQDYFGYRNIIIIAFECHSKILFYSNVTCELVKVIEYYA